MINIYKTEDRIKNFFIASFIKHINIYGILWFKNNARIARFALREYETYFRDFERNFTLDVDKLSIDDVDTDSNFIPKILLGGFDYNINLLSLVIVWDYINPHEKLLLKYGNNPLYIEKSNFYNKLAKLIPYNKEFVKKTIEKRLLKND